MTLDYGGNIITLMTAERLIFEHSFPQKREDFPGLNLRVSVAYPHEIDEGLVDVAEFLSKHLDYDQREPRTDYEAEHYTGAYTVTLTHPTDKEAHKIYIVGAKQSAGEIWNNNGHLGTNFQHSDDVLAAFMVDAKREAEHRFRISCYLGVGSLKVRFLHNPGLRWQEVEKKLPPVPQEATPYGYQSKTSLHLEPVSWQAPIRLNLELGSDLTLLSSFQQEIILPSGVVQATSPAFATAEILVPEQKGFSQGPSNQADMAFGGWAPILPKFVEAN